MANLHVSGIQSLHSKLQITFCSLQRKLAEGCFEHRSYFALLLMLLHHPNKCNVLTPTEQRESVAATRKVSHRAQHPTRSRRSRPSEGHATNTFLPRSRDANVPSQRRISLSQPTSQTWLCCGAIARGHTLSPVSRSRRYAAGNDRPS